MIIQVVKSLGNPDWVPSHGFISYLFERQSYREKGKRRGAKRKGEKNGRSWGLGGTGRRVSLVHSQIDYTSLILNIEKGDMLSWQSWFCFKANFYNHDPRYTIKFHLCDYTNRVRLILNSQNKGKVPSIFCSYSIFLNSLLNYNSQGMIL